MLPRVPLVVISLVLVGIGYLAYPILFGDDNEELNPQEEAGESEIDEQPTDVDDGGDRR